MTDITSLENATQTAKEGLTHATDNYSACFKRTLWVIEIIEENLRERRSRIEDCQIRHEQLAREYRQLCKSLEWETRDLAQKFTSIIGDLGTNVEIMKLLLGDRSAPAPTSDLAIELSGLAPIPDYDREARRNPDEGQDLLAGLRPALNRVFKKDNQTTALSAHSEDGSVA